MKDKNYVTEHGFDINDDDDIDGIENNIFRKNKNDDFNHENGASRNNVLILDTNGKKLKKDF